MLLNQIYPLKIPLQINPYRHEIDIQAGSGSRDDDAIGKLDIPVVIRAEALRKLDLVFNLPIVHRRLGGDGADADKGFQSPHVLGVNFDQAVVVERLREESRCAGIGFALSVIAFVLQALPMGVETGVNIQGRKTPTHDPDQVDHIGVVISPLQTLGRVAGYQQYAIEPIVFDDAE